MKFCGNKTHKAIQTRDFCLWFFFFQELPHLINANFFFLCLILFDLFASFKIAQLAQCTQNILFAVNQIFFSNRIAFS
jgi:hypothetical protein